MESNANPAVGLLGFLMFGQLVFLLALLIGGLYALFALGRAAAGLDRLASAVEAWVANETAKSRTSGTMPSSPAASPFPVPVPPTPLTPPAPAYPSGNVAASTPAPAAQQTPGFDNGVHRSPSEAPGPVVETPERTA